jgi:hypothetical protein
MKKSHEELEKKIAYLEELLSDQPKSTSITDCVFNGSKDSEAKAAIASAVEAGMVALQELAATSAPLLEIH